MAKNSANEQNAMSAAGVFKAIDNVLKKPGCGCSGSLDYMEQSSWLLFLHYLNAREEERKLEARLNTGVAQAVAVERVDPSAGCRGANLIKRRCLMATSF